MIFTTIGRTKRRRKNLARVFFVATVLCALPATSRALPSRLVLAVDGVAYRDMLALQAGVTRTNFWGHTYQRRAFTAEEGYFPVSRMISTFPSVSDVAWTDIFGDRPLSGYQRTYFSAAVNSMIAINGVTTTMEHEHQMDWQAQNGFIRSLGYVMPVHTFRYEMRGTDIYFWRTARKTDTFYAYLRASDDSQHLDRDIFAVLCELDQKIQKLRAQYKAREGRDLEIVILSDHGHNHAGRGIRLKADAFLEKAGYHIARSINGPQDVVLPVVGIESWVEIHCLPSEAEKLSQLLCRLKGVDVLAAVVPGQTNRFLVMNSNGERADILWHPAQNTFCYVPQTGDPINYRPVVEAMTRNHQLDADGFGTADAWMAATMTNQYPLALERIVRGLTHVTLNPATILISLDNRYVNDFWLTDLGSRLVTCRSTHGGLDDLCSDGIVMSNFTPTHDTSSDRVAAQFGDFADVKDFRAMESGAELVTKKEQSLARIPHVPFDRQYQQLSDDGLYLRIWSPELASLDANAPIEAEIIKVRSYFTSSSRKITFDQPLSFPEKTLNERVYQIPSDLKLEPSGEYNISFRVKDKKKSVRLSEFDFHADQNGRPAPY